MCKARAPSLTILFATFFALVVALACTMALVKIVWKLEDSRKTPRQTSAPNINGRAYPIIDHTFDVVVVGAGGADLRDMWARARRA